MRLSAIGPGRRLRRPVGAIVAALLLAAASVGHADEALVTIGDKSIRVPIEEGYVAASKRVPELHRMTQAALPPTNRLVETYYTPAQLEAVQRGEVTDGYYFMIQTMRALEPLQVSIADWERMQPDITRGMVGSQVQEAIRNDADSRDARISEAAGREVAMRIGDITTPEIYGRSPESVRFLMNIPARFEVGGETHEVAVGAAGALVLVQNKILFVYWYVSPATPESVDVARQRLDATVERIVSLNASDATVESSPQLGGGLDWGKLAMKGLVGAAVAVIVLLAGLLLFRRK